MKYLLTKMRKLYRNSRISQKLFLAFSMMIAIPAIVVSFLFIRTQESQLYKDAMAMAAAMSHELTNNCAAKWALLRTLPLLR